MDTIKGACTLVVDFTDFCFHSYFSYMDDLCEKVAIGETPMDIKYELLTLQLLLQNVKIFVFHCQNVLQFCLGVSFNLNIF